MNGKNPIKGVKPEDHPEWACVVTKPTQMNGRTGIGVLSWHCCKAEAEFNAHLLDGKVIPVDYHKGELITPYLAVAVVKAFKEQSHE